MHAHTHNTHTCEHIHTLTYMHICTPHTHMHVCMSMDSVTYRLCQCPLPLQPQPLSQSTSLHYSHLASPPCSPTLLLPHSSAFLPPHLPPPPPPPPKVHHGQCDERHSQLRPPSGRRCCWSTMAGHLQENAGTAPQHVARHEVTVYGCHIEICPLNYTKYSNCLCIVGCICS